MFFLSATNTQSQEDLMGKHVDELRAVDIPYTSVFSILKERGAQDRALEKWAPRSFAIYRTRVTWR